MQYSFVAALVLALAGIGDSFLYAYLPSNGQNMGLSVFWVGVILSINRFTRLFLNGRIAYYVSKHGLKKITIAATIIAALTTLSYGFVNSVFLWLFVRILWGISFSTLRLGSIVYALGNQRQGVSLGLSRSIIEGGPIAGLLIGTHLTAYFNRSDTFIFLSTISLVGIFVALLLPKIEIETISKKDLVLTFPSSLNILVFINTFIIEGMMIVLLGKLLSVDSKFSGTDIIALVGVYLAFRRLCLVMLSPVAGWMADKWGFQKIFNYTNFFILTGIALVATGLTNWGIIVAFVFGAMNASVAPGGAVSGSGSMLKEVSDNATWRDIGAAGGTLIGGLLLNFPYLHIIFMLALIPLTAGIVIQLNNSKKKTIPHGIS